MSGTDDTGRLRILFAASSPYSGSTLLPFLLILHPELAGIGHTTGWEYAEGEEFLCSCGAPLEQCPLFRAVAEDQRRAGHPFEFREFGFDYRFARNERINGCLAASIPLVRSSSCERVRDRIVGLVSPLRSKLRDIDHANRIFMQTTLRYHGASVFVDGFQEPHRLRHLRRIPDTEISILHLVRDVRGVVFSNMTKKGWSAREAALNWLNQQFDILRIASEFGRTKTVFYESLCDETDATLRSIHEFLGIQPVPFAGDFKQAEHHILGNQMRFGDGTIVRSRSWEKKLSPEDRRVVEETCRRYAERRSRAIVGDLIAQYLDPAP